MAITMDGIFVNGQKATFRPEDILSGDASDYTKEIGPAVEAWLEENVTGGEQVTDTTLTLPGVPADSKTVGDQLSGVKEDLTDITGNSGINMVEGGYIVCNITSGIDINASVANAGYRHAAVPCSNGDKFIVNAKGASAGRAYAFVDASGNLIENASQNVTVVNKLLVAPQNAAYLIINDNNTGAVSYVGELVKSKVNSLITNGNFLNYIWERGSINSTTGRETTSIVDKVRTSYISVTGGEKIFVDYDPDESICYIFEFSDSYYGGFVRANTLTGSTLYTVPSGINYVRIILGAKNGSEVQLDYARNVKITEQIISANLIYANGANMPITFTTGNYMASDGAHAASGWCYTSNIPCKYGQILKVQNSYSADYRPVFFFDVNNKCVGFYDTGLNNGLIEEFSVTVPEGATHAVVNSRSEGRENLAVSIADTNVPLADDIAMKSWQNISIKTGHKLIDMFSKIKAAGPLFTIVDDDGRNLTQITNFHRVVSAAGIVGCNALATKFIENMNETDRAIFIDTLKAYEADGFQNVLHCYDHDLWESSINSTMTRAEQFAAITSDISKGIRDMESTGFINWKHWIVPQGKTDLECTETCARNLGFNAAYDVANRSFNHFANRDNLYRRYSIPRMELYPEDEGHSGLTLQLIKNEADICTETGGWLIVCTHFYQPGWTNNDPTFSRVTEMINYIMGLGFKNVTLSGGMSYFEDIYRMYGLF